jgi:predicted CoA-substrate-specific enzyme activase
MEKYKRAWLGIDGGSVSIKLALIDDKKDLISSAYLKNQGIIDTLKQGFEKIQENYDNGYKISGVGVTGSGRKFIGMLVGSDVVETEILAHTYGALEYYPNVRTVMDIGGEDSKIMSIRNGILEDFKLNSVCGAGTGSVIDAIAARIGINVENIGDLALKSTQNLAFPGKCGIFAQSAVVSRLNSGANKSDILMGVIRALVNNYLTMAKSVCLESPYVYQGATAKNKAIVRALEEQLEDKVEVPEHCDIMGAIGAALIAKEEQSIAGKINGTKFKGFDLVKKDYETRIMVGKGCENHCEITGLYENKELIGFVGNRCDNCIRDLERYIEGDSDNKELEKVLKGGV